MARTWKLESSETWNRTKLDCQKEKKKEKGNDFQFLIPNDILLNSLISALDWFSPERLPAAVDRNSCGDPQPNMRQSLGETPQKRENKDCRSQRSRTPGEYGPPESIKQGSLGLTETEAAIQSLHGCALGILRTCCGCLDWGFCGTPKSRGEGVSDSFACSWDPFFSHWVILSEQP